MEAVYRYDQLENIFKAQYQIRVTPKTITRTITTSVLVKLEWAKLNGGRRIWIATETKGAFLAGPVKDEAFYCGFVFKTQAEAQAAHDAFLESTK
jgi:hypothetical protein